MTTLPQSRRYSSISTIPVPADPDNSSVFKVITLGNVGVGKSTLIASYARGTFQHDLSEQTNVDGKIVKRGDSILQLALWDTAGQERYDSITSNYYRGTHGCLLCFDISNEQSYSDLITWYDKLKNHCDPVPPTLLVGIKSDLRQSKQHTQTTISSTDCRLAARNLGLCYKEVTCHKQDTIENTFNTLIEMIETNRRRLERTEDEDNNNVTLVTEKPPEKSFCRNLC